MRFLPLLLLFPLAAQGATITLGASQDNTLYQDTIGGLSNGAGPTFLMGKTGGGSIRRGLIEFDLSAIPAGSIIDSVSLNLFLVQKFGRGLEPLMLDQTAHQRVAWILARILLRRIGP